jgi:hypothetical protein
MNDTKYVVPEEGLKVAQREALGADFPTLDFMRLGIAAFIRWQSENPQVPNDEQVTDWFSPSDFRALEGRTEPLKQFALTVQRHIYLAPEPEVPEEIKDLLLTEQSHKNVQPLKGELNSMIIEAYRRGKESKRAKNA